MIRDLLGFLRALYRYSPPKFILSVVLNVLLGLIGGVGIMMLVPMLYYTRITSHIGNQNQLLAQLNSLFQSIPNTVGLLIVLLSYCSITFMQAILIRKQSLLNAEITQGYIRFQRVSLYENTVFASWSCLLDKQKSEIANAFTMELPRVGAGTVYLFNAISQVIVAVFQIILALFISAPVTLFVLVSGGLFFFAMNSMVRNARTLGTSLNKINKELVSQIIEQLSGLKEVKCFGVEVEQVRRFSEISVQQEHNIIGFTRLQSKLDFLYKIGAAAIISIFFFSVVTLFKVNPASLLIIAIIFARLWPAFSSFQGNLQNIHIMLPSFQHLTALNDDLRQAAEVGTVCLNYSPRERIEIRDRIRLVDVFFKYHGCSSNILKGLNIEIPARSMIALVGRSGAGKSTIADILLGLLEPSKGQLTVDDLTITPEWLHRWRSSIGYVLQDSYLIHNTIRANLSRFNPRATEEEMLEALELAAARDFIEGLPEGLDTVIGDRGVKLSGGERQRIVLARALLRKPELLVLDEATSSLDFTNEYKIQKALENLRGRITLVVIAHRLSTIQNADNIVVIDDGQVVESGSFDKLTNKDSGYFRSLLDATESASSSLC